MSATGLLVAGTSSDAGKTVITAGICRWLYRQGVKVAPFKAQNMSNNSVVVSDATTPDGRLTTGEIGRAQALQAAACCLEPSVRFNPILLKPSSDNSSQVVALGRAIGNVGSTNYVEMQRKVRQVAYDTLAQLQAEFEVVICEGAGSLAEINLRETDYVNMGLAREANWPVLLVGDIDRGGVFASLYGSLALLSPEDQRLISAFIINKFRGDASLLTSGLERLEELTGRRVLGVLPWQLDLWLDSEDYLPYRTTIGRTPDAWEQRHLRIAVVRLPRISNATDMDPLASEPGVEVQFTAKANELAAADLIVIPGSKSTVADMEWLVEMGLDQTLREHVDAGRPLLGICGGFQMMATHIHDEVESRRGSAEGLGLLPTEIEFDEEKTLAWSEGIAFGGVAVRGYEIHHGYVSKMPSDAEALIQGSDGRPEGLRAGNVFGTHWHGVFESDDFRRTFLKEAAHLAGRDDFQMVTDTSFKEQREKMLNALGDLVKDNLDTALLRQLIDTGAPANLPTIQPTLV